MTGKHILYGGIPSQSVVVEMLLAEAEIPYELRRVDITKQENQAQEFLRLNPAGFVPALMTPEGEMLHENAAILVYLCERFELDQFMPPSGDPARAMFWSKLFYHTNDIVVPTKRYFYPARFSTSESHVDAVRTAARDMALDRWQILEEYLSDHGPYHLGDRLSVVDLHMAVWVVYGLDTADQIMKQFPSVNRAYMMVRERPLSGRLLGELQTAMGHWRDTLGLDTVGT
ncbi:MAG: glutathione S-transferase family protein [Pseudomonadota bacterium]